MSKSDNMYTVNPVRLLIIHVTMYSAVCRIALFDSAINFIVYTFNVNYEFIEFRTISNLSPQQQKKLET